MNTENQYKEFDKMVLSLTVVGFSTNFIKEKAALLGIPRPSGLCEHLKVLGYSQNGVKWTKVGEAKTFRKFTF